MVVRRSAALAVSLGILLAATSCRNAGARDRPEERSDLRDLGTREDPAQVEARSLLDGEPLHPPPLEARVLEQRVREHAAALHDFLKHPDDPDAIVWLGRRTAYLGRFREAIEVFTRGVELFPDDPRMVRHRGHRLITLRRFAEAERDLERAAELIEDRPDEIEPAGLPNAQGVELDTLNHSVHYHLGLARTLQGDLEGALEAYRDCLAAATNADAVCSASYWLVVILGRLGREQEAAQVLEPIRRDEDVVEYHEYHRLLLMYRGELEPMRLLQDARSAGRDSVAFATLGYGIGNWLRCEGRVEEARDLFREVVAGASWHAFGHIAAEVDLASGRWGQRPQSSSRPGARRKTTPPTSSSNPQRR